MTESLFVKCAFLAEGEGRRSTVTLLLYSRSYNSLCNPPNQKKTFWHILTHTKTSFSLSVWPQGEHKRDDSMVEMRSKTERWLEEIFVLKQNILKRVEDKDMKKEIWFMGGKTCILSENVNGFGDKDTLFLLLGSHGPSAGWSFLTHGELLPGRGLQPGQGAGWVWAEWRWAAVLETRWV